VYSVINGTKKKKKKKKKNYNISFSRLKYLELMMKNGHEAQY